MKEVWLVSSGAYSDYSVMAVCSSHEQACGVAVLHGWDEDGTVEMWEEADGIPPFRLLHSCLVRVGRDSHTPLDVSFSSRAVAVDAPNPLPSINAAPPTNPWKWVQAKDYPSKEEAESAARQAYAELRSASV